MVNARSEAAKQSEKSQSKIATPREARLAMTIFLYLHFPHFLHFITSSLPHSLTSFTSVTLDLPLRGIIKPPTRGRTPSVDGLLPISGFEEEVKEGFEAEPRPLTSLLVRQISR